MVMSVGQMSDVFIYSYQRFFFTDWSDNYKAVILDFRELLESYKRVIRKLPEFDGSLEEG